LRARELRATNCDEMRGEVAANACACAFACSIATTCGVGWLPSRAALLPLRHTDGCESVVERSAVHQRNCAAYVTAFSHRRDEEATLFPDQRWADTTPRGCTHPAHVHHLPFQRGAEARAWAQRTHTHTTTLVTNVRCKALWTWTRVQWVCVCVCGKDS